MGNKVIIYDSGQVYEIDSDQLYVPYFISGSRANNPTPANTALKDVLAQIRNENEKEDKLPDDSGNNIQLVTYEK